MGNICGNSPAASQSVGRTAHQQRKLPMVIARKGSSLDYLRYTEKLNERVKAQFIIGNESIKFIDSSVEVVESEGIPFEVRLITSLASKPKLDTAKADQTQSKLKKKVAFDPFVPPFEPGLFITDLSETHRLLFNKFCICKEHSLVVTTNMERQDAPLTHQDFEAMLLTLQSLKAFVFFNRGFLSGMSILHKHFQVIPYSSIGQTRLPVEAAILAELSEGVGKFSGFEGMRHCVKVFNGEDGLEMPGTISQLEAQAQVLRLGYHACLEELSLSEDLLAEELSFNMFVTPRLICIVERRANSVKGEDGVSVDINTLGFAGTLAVKNEASLELLKSETPMELLRKVAAKDSEITC